MKRYFKSIVSVAAFIVLASGTLSSCIKDELPNIEVDITNVKSADAGFITSQIFENSITVYVDTRKTELNALTLNMELSEDATISPDPATVHDYSEPRVFTVTSEDKAWVKNWTINVRPLSDNVPTKFTFDNWVSPNGTKYMIPKETIVENGKTLDLDMWATTNNSLSILLEYMFADKIDKTQFGCSPTDITATGKGQALKLRTWDIQMFDPNKPFVSGCLFLGEFDGADTNPLTGTHFGTLFNKRPKSFKGYYKYEPGIITSTGKNDEGLIEAVLYRYDVTVPYLTGYTIKDKTFSNIVAYAEINPNEATNGYKEFNIPFTYTQEVSDEDLKNWKYRLAVYFASSKAGDEYIGSGNTVLYIDDVEIVCE